MAAKFCLHINQKKRGMYSIQEVSHKNIIILLAFLTYRENNSCNINRSNLRNIEKPVNVLRSIYTGQKTPIKILCDRPFKNVKALYLVIGYLNINVLLILKVPEVIFSPRAKKNLPRLKNQRKIGIFMPPPPHTHKYTHSHPHAHTHNNTCGRLY